ncbi:MAG: DUF502 domain-containing protein [Bdellovibrionales bacterium]|nr:DUF502 domain-containing protein [Oligoflexia bacterium]
MSPYRSKIDKFQSIIKDHFLSGLLILAPMLIVTIVFLWIFGGVLGWIERVPLALLFTRADDELAGLIRFFLSVGILLAGVVLISMVGFFSRLYFGKKAFKWVGEGIQRIPFFGAIYASLSQLFAAISSGGGKQFSRVVFVEYPRKDMWSVAFVTGNANFKGLPAGCLSVFIPTVPNPTSGFHLMLREADVVESGLRVDEAFKLILSLGVAVPNPTVSPEKDWVSP